MAANGQAPIFTTGRLAGFNASQYANQYITIEQVLEIKKGFDLFDIEGGGSIDPKQLKNAINSLGIQTKAETVYAMIAELDKDGTGTLEFDQFFQMMVHRPSTNQSKEQIHKVFIAFDFSRTGYISMKDLRKVSKNLGELHDDAQLQEMIDRADLDGDGLVSEEQFYLLMTRKEY